LRRRNEALANARASAWAAIGARQFDQWFMVEDCQVIGGKGE